jgi:MFS family permease
MEPEWLRMASSPGMWVIAFFFAGNALIASYLFYRLAKKTGRRMKMKEEVMHEALKASFITSLGPAMGSFVGLTVMVLALGGAYAFARESAAVGSIMYELIAARFGAEAAGVPLTREGMTIAAVPIIFWVGAIGSFGWVLTGGVFTRWLPKLKDLLGGGDTNRLQVISVAMMLGAFGRMLTNDSIRPLITKGQWPAMVASITGGLAAAIWLKTADKMGKPNVKEYFLVIALIVGMVCGEITRLALTP